jgi:hypothetical protein
VDNQRSTRDRQYALDAAFFFGASFDKLIGHIDTASLGCGRYSDEASTLSAIAHGCLTKIARA